MNVLEAMVCNLPVAAILLILGAAVFGANAAGQNARWLADRASRLTVTRISAWMSPIFCMDLLVARWRERPHRGEQPDHGAATRRRCQG